MLILCMDLSDCHQRGSAYVGTKTGTYKKLDEKLSLTDTQKSQIRDLYADFYKQKYPKEKRKEAMEKLITDIAAVLTSDQQVLYKQLQEDAAAERRKRTPKK